MTSRGNEWPSGGGLMTGRHELIPAERMIHGGTIVVLEGYLCTRFDQVVLDKIRGPLRGRDAQVDQIFHALHRARLNYVESYASATGLALPTKLNAPATPQQNDFSPKDA